MLFRSNEVTVLKQRFTEQLAPKKMKEAIVRMMYAEMLGHDASFGHIHAVNVAQQTSLVSKRVGYLASTVCLLSIYRDPQRVADCCPTPRRWETRRGGDSRTNTPHGRTNFLDIVAARCRART